MRRWSRWPSTSPAARSWPTGSTSPPTPPASARRPFDPQLAEEFWRAFATAGNLTLHIHRRLGKNTHHMLEASFKGVARSLRDAVRIEGGGIPSTKGSL